MEGGIVVTNEQELYHILLSLKTWLDKRFTRKIFIINKSKNNFDESFRFILPGYNLRPLEMSGAIGSIQLKKFPTFLDREGNAKFFREK